MPTIAHRISTATATIDRIVGFEAGWLIELMLLAWADNVGFPKSAHLSKALTPPMHCSEIAGPAPGEAPKAIAVIPARGGCKSVPRKNMRLLGGVPLIVHTIQAALASRSLDAVVVSTEDEEIARIASGAGATVLECPSASATDVVRHVPQTHPASVPGARHAGCRER